MSLSTEPPSAAFCEDFNEDSGTSLPETRKVANVAAKRSKPELAVKVAGSTENTSDSGYSSRTAGRGAAGGSPDPERKKSRGPTPPRLDTTFQDREPRPYGGGMKSASRQSEKVRPGDDQLNVQRTSSRVRKLEQVKHDRGSCWECDKYGYHAPTPKPSLQQAKNATAPTSPSRSRKEALPQTKQEVKSTQNTEARPRPRRSSTSNAHNSRPVSFHAGMGFPVEMGYPYATSPSPLPWNQTPSYAMCPSCPPSAFPANFPMTSVSTIVNPNVGTQAATPYYESPIPQRPSYSRRLSSHGQPIIQQEYPPPPAGYRPPSRQERRDGSRSRHGHREEDYQRMPPPPKPETVQLSRRPSTKKYITTTTAQTVRRPKHDDPKSVPRASSHNRPSGSERPAPILVRPQNRKSVSYEDDPAPTRRIEEPLNRRTTLYGHEGLKDLEDLERKQQAAEEYQRLKGSNPSPSPLIAGSLQKVRSVVDAPHRSETGSHRSQNSSSKGSGTKTQQENDITMTMKGVTLGISGTSVDNRDIRIKSKASGAMQLQIDGKRPRRYSLASIKHAPSSNEKEKVPLDNASERASRKSSRSGRSGK